MENSTPSSPEGSLKALKFIFFAMMLVLIGGALFLFVTIYQRNQGTISPGGCSSGAMHFPVQDEVVQVTKEGNTLTLLTRVRNNKQQVLVIDSCTGKMLRAVNLYIGQEKDYIPSSEVDAPQENNGASAKPRVDIMIKDANTGE